MASSSSVYGGDYARLVGLYRANVLDTDTFLRMTGDLERTNSERLAETHDAVRGGGPSQGTSVGDGARSPAAASDDDLVGEDGMPFDHTLRSLDSASSKADGSVVGGFDDDEHDAFQQEGEESPSDDSEGLVETPLRPAPPIGQETWVPNTKVQSSVHGEVTFLRLGNAADCINNGLARIKYSRLKPGTKFKKQDHICWVQLDTLMALEHTGTIGSADGEGRSPVRRSPRVEGRTAAQQADAVLPERAAIERKRKLAEKPEAPVRGRQKTVLTTTETEVPLEQRLREFPDHSLVIELGSLKCVACSYVCPNKVSSIRSHCRMVNKSTGEPTAHARKLEKLAKRVDQDAVLKVGLVQYFEEHPSEAVGTKDHDQLVYRYRVAESFVKHPPLTGIDHHKPLLQRSGYSLPDSPNFRRFIPRIEEAEDKLLNSEMVGQYIGIAFDGTTRLGEAINTTGRWCTKDFEIIMRLLDFTTLKKHVDNVALAATDPGRVEARCEGWSAG